jgi:hypothetical protein
MPAAKSLEMLDQYVSTAHSPQNALDIFEGEWFSRLPDTHAGLVAGQAALFSDARIQWFSNEIGGFEAQTLLELGPLEAGHTYMLEQAGAKEIVAIEGNKRAYLKCLIIKELFRLQRSRFLCGDIIESLRADESAYDLCVASGVLYHMRNPAELISLLSQRCRKHVYIWTHYFDPEITPTSYLQEAKQTGGIAAEFSGFKHTLYRYDYKAALAWAGFCGGSSSYCHWMTRDDVLRCLKYFSFGDIRIGFDDPATPNGPSFALIASKVQI